MEKTTFQKLLEADEEKVRNTMQANISVDKNRKLCAENLSSEFSTILLKYNAAYSHDKMRQSAADLETSVVLRTLDMLTVGSAEKEAADHREHNFKAPVLAVIAIAFCAAAAIVISKYAVYGYLCMIAAVIFAHFSGRIWFHERRVDVRAAIDAEKLWDTLNSVAGTMDNKIDEFLEHSSEYAGPQNIKRGEGELLDRESIQLFGELLEAFYFGNGEHALNQLGNIRTYLTHIGIEMKDYDGNNDDMFEFMPSKSKTMTLRPALMSGSELLLPGRAVKPE